MNDEYLLDKEGSNKISTFYKVLYILSIIVLVFLGIGFFGLLIGFSAIETYMPQVINAISQSETQFPVELLESILSAFKSHHVAIIIIVEYACLVGLFVYYFIYLAKAKNYTNHFTEKNANKLLQIGLVIIIAPIVLNFIFGLLTSGFSTEMAKIISDYISAHGEEAVEVTNSTNVSLNVFGENTPSIALGLSIILMSMYVRHASKILVKIDKFNEEKIAAE